MIGIVISISPSLGPTYFLQQPFAACFCIVLRHRPFLTLLTSLAAHDLVAGKIYHLKKEFGCYMDEIKATQSYSSALLRNAHGAEQKLLLQPQWEGWDTSSIIRDTQICV